jgi:hypothetical protein
LNRCTRLCRPLPNHSATPPGPVHPGFVSLVDDRVEPAISGVKTPKVAPMIPLMSEPTRCPDCGSREISETNRISTVHGRIKTWICGYCHWASDPRIGRPAADRGKNFTLRRRLASAMEANETGST